MNQQTGSNSPAPVPEIGWVESLRQADVQASLMWRDTDRWKTCHVAPNPLAEVIVDRVWGQLPSLTWQVLAVSLVAQRLEDDLPTPLTVADPLATTLAALIDEEMQVRRSLGLSRT